VGPDEARSSENEDAQVRLGGEGPEVFDGAVQEVLAQIEEARPE
jgi:hypothetical protein